MNPKFRKRCQACKSFSEHWPLCCQTTIIRPSLIYRETDGQSKTSWNGVRLGGGVAVGVARGNGDGDHGFRRADGDGAGVVC